jgi:hypothetical protein
MIESIIKKLLHHEILIMKKLSLILTTVFVLGIANFVKADNEKNNHQVNIDIPTLAIIDIESATNSLTITLSPSAPTEAGLGLSFMNISNSDLWLNYSSIVNKNSKNFISAKIEGELPEGITIELFVGDCLNGKGEVGKRKGGNKAVTLSTTGKEIIHNIRTGFTGNGPWNGHNLSYSLKIDNNSIDYEKIVSESKDINVVYTIYNHKLE